MQHIYSIEAGYIAEKTSKFYMSIEDVERDLDDFGQNKYFEPKALTSPYGDYNQICHDSTTVEFSNEEIKENIHVDGLRIIYECRGYPIIGYIKNGHVNVHQDPNRVKILGFCERTFIVCSGSTDENGGTFFYFGDGDTLIKDGNMDSYNKVLIKESVTTNWGALFIGDMLHSGKPVGEGKYKIIVQLGVTTMLDVPKETIELKFSNGSYVIRKSYVDGILEDKDWEYVSIEDFYPIFLALYGRPTVATELLKSNLSQDHYYISGVRLELSDILSERVIPCDGFSVHFDEAVHLRRCKAIIFNGRMEKIKETSSYEEFFDFMENNQKILEINISDVFENVIKFNKSPFSPFKQIGIEGSHSIKFYDDNGYTDYYRTGTNVMDTYTVAYVAWSI